MSIYEDHLDIINDLVLNEDNRDDAKRVIIKYCEDMLLDPDEYHLVWEPGYIYVELT